MLWFLDAISLQVGRPVGKLGWLVKYFIFFSCWESQLLWPKFSTHFDPKSTDTKPSIWFTRSFKTRDVSKKQKHIWLFRFTCFSRCLALICTPSWDAVSRAAGVPTITALRTQLLSNWAEQSSSYGTVMGSYNIQLSDLVLNTRVGGYLPNP